MCGDWKPARLVQLEWSVPWSCVGVDVPWPLLLAPLTHEAEHWKTGAQGGDAPPTGRRRQEGPQVTAHCRLIGISLMISDVAHLF